MEHFFSCPACGAKISMLLEPLAGSQQYVEDCEVCCRPLQIGYLFHDRTLQRFSAKTLDES